MAIVLALTALAANCTPEPLSETDGFRGIRWGTAIQDISGMKLLDEEGPVKFYERSGDPVAVSGVNVDRIIYGFYNGAFYNVTISYTSSPNFTKFKEIYLQKYGNPPHAEEGKNQYFWQIDSINILLNFNAETDKGRVHYSFVPIESQMK